VRSPLSGLAPARRRLAVLALGGVAMAVVAGIGVLLVGRLSGTADQSEPGPVLVVPGYGADLDALNPLVAEVRRAGREAVVFEPTEGGTGDLRVQARRLGVLAEQTMDRTGAGSVDIVGYSAGGVVARLYVRDEGGASVVRRVLTVGSPHHGSEVASLAAEVAGGCPTACEQLATGSELLRRLDSGDETPDGPRWATVRTADDEIVTPSESALLDGALNIEVQRLCPAATTSHGGLPGDPVVLATLRSALGKAAPRVPREIIC
jgi:triacylglycerol esterase/lipase EstA (alpha/beta hydrolase family)